MKFYLLVLIAVAYLAYVSSDSCVQCNSQSDERCATDPMNILAKECRNASKCYTRILEGHTIRGCSIDLNNKTASHCNNEMECLICSFTEGCNRQIFPIHRAQCLQCSGNSTNSSCAVNVYEKATVCPLYQLGDKCYIRNTNRTNVAGSFQRGCLSSAIAHKVCIKEQNCFTCDGTGCNFLAPNDTHIPLARDGGVVAMLSMALLIACMLLGWAM